MRSIKQLTYAIALICAGTSFAATTVVEHTGSNDPISEGWQKLTGSQFPSIGTVGPAGGVEPAWQIDTTGSGYDYYYGYQAGSQVLTDAEADGWRIATRFRFVAGTGDATYTMQWNPVYTNMPGAEHVRFNLQARSVDDELLLFAGGVSGLEQGLGTLSAGTFYELSAADIEGNGQVDVWLDGVQIADDIVLSGSASSTRDGLVWFGEGGNADRAVFQVSYALLETGPVPEPGTGMLLVLTSLILRGRKKGRHTYINASDVVRAMNYHK